MTLSSPKSGKGFAHFAVLGFIGGTAAILFASLFGAYLPANVGKTTL